MPITQSMKQWLVAFVLMICVTLAFFDKISIAVLFSDPEFQNVMAIRPGDKEKLGWLMTSFLLAYGFSSLFLSFVGDIFNPKKLLFWSVASWGVLMFLMGTSKSYGEMFFYRVLLGIFEGPLLALAYTIVKQTYQERQQARASTLFLLGTPVGASLGFPITAFILHHFGWEMTFHVLASMTLIVLAVVYFGLKDLQLKSGAEKRSSTKRLTFKEHVRNSKVLVTTPAFWAVCIFNIAMMTYLWGLNGWLPSYLIEAKGFNLKEFGQLSSLPFIAMLIGEVIGAFLSDKTGKRALQVFAGLFLGGIGMGIMITMTSPIMVIFAMSVSAFFWGMSASAIFALLARVSDASVAATAGGVFNGLANFASAIVPVVIGYIVTQTGNFDNGILFLAVVAVLGSLVLVPWLKKY